ncbi:hypothetical protein LA635_3356 [Erwinia amylovora LA635]|uniref:Uncharacterized protein n=1 Tax=Erwinia amylovora TaxID=552 RepID=Q4R0I5_ERWAM|nr:hypothetical protein BEI72_10270 [Erwinia amylovora]CDK16980.1 hypothetical protein LA635_3356 [Erwinia amylovora LA635]CDK20348.1 hypothetical protein LA636_3356 [Erwinia amylovora LA636]CDK23719.1 hypothetical protein LA637_3359 [Erwinia amylovora LA637]GAJ87455.1 hypothetical protein EAM01S_01_03100 [Erwinia amylovora NBRC 12687 = CFBP 1232]
MTPEKKDLLETLLILPIVMPYHSPWITFPFNEITDKGIVAVNLDILKINPAGNVLVYQHIIPRLVAACSAIVLRLSEERVG